MADSMSTMVQLQQQKLKSMDMNKLEQMGERMEDLRVDMEEIEDVMQRTYDMDEDVDENEYDDMMEELQNEMILEEKMGTGNVKNNNNTTTVTNNNQEKIQNLL